MAKGIKDKVAILGMGCSRFGERWDASAEDLMVEAYTEALADAGIGPEQIDASWFSTHMDDIGVGRGGTPMGIALRLPFIGVTRVENFCAGGSEAVRAAVYAVASGACDIALAVGVEKLKDTGYGGLPLPSIGTYIPQWYPTAVAPANFAQLATAYGSKHSVNRDDLKRAIAHISVKSHANGALNPKAHLRKLITEEQVLNAPIIAEPLGLFDCCGVSDGAAAAIVTTPEIARALGKTDLVTFKALQVSTSNGWEMHSSEWDGSYVHTARVAARRAYEEAGVSSPRDEIGMMEVHDCFSITELVTTEDLFISPEGGAIRDVLDGFYDSGGQVPCQIDGGLKCFGHPIGASGLRMLYEMYLQLQDRAGERQLADPRLGLTHNLGGQRRRTSALSPLLAPMTAENAPLVLEDRPTPHVVRLRLNRPDKRNAIDHATREALLEAAERSLADPTARSIVFGGVGGVFSAGGDLPSMAGLDDAQAEARLLHIHRICRAFEGADLPIVSAMEGVAAGASVGLALLGDHVVVGPSTRILFPFIKLGLVPDWGLLRSLPQRIGVGRARHLVFAGAAIDGAEAVNIGLADELVDDDAVMTVALERAEAFASLPREATARIKARFRAFGRLDFAQDLDAERVDQVACLTHGEFAEGLSAQLGRRAPRFIDGTPGDATE